jgi:hypothetical protein
MPMLLHGRARSWSALVGGIKQFFLLLLVASPSPGLTTTRAELGRVSGVNWYHGHSKLLGKFLLMDVVILNRIRQWWHAYGPNDLLYWLHICWNEEIGPPVHASNLQYFLPNCNIILCFSSTCFENKKKSVNIPETQIHLNKHVYEAYPQLGINKSSRRIVTHMQHGRQHFQHQRYKISSTPRVVRASHPCVCRKTRCNMSGRCQKFQNNILHVGEPMI